MSQLILTEQERASDCYLKWDDAALGRLVRHMSYCITDRFGEHGVNTAMAAHLLVDFVSRQQRSHQIIELGSTTLDGQTKGEWRIEITQGGVEHVA